jgi:hypothetical protein
VGATEGEPVLRLILRDISRRLELEAEVSELHEQVALSAALIDVSRLTSGPEPLALLLRSVTRLAAGVLPGEVGIILVDRPHLESAVASGPLARALDARQRDAGGGPAFEAIEREGPVLGRVSDWDELAGAADEGVVDVVALPLQGGDAPPAGALNVYATEPMTERELVVLAGFAEQAAVAFDNARLFASASKLARELTEALESRAVIEQAKGMLMAREGCDANTAIEILKRASQRENVKLRDIALRLVARTGGGSPVVRGEVPPPSGRSRRSPAGPHRSG